MSTPWESPIIRVTTGLLNTVNDSVIAGQAKLAGVSRYAGQLGKHLYLSSEQIAQMFSPTVGTLYGGRYRYVRVSEDDVDSPAMTPGHIAFWDTTLTNWQTKFQVTRDENLSSADNAVMIAGVFIGNIEPGNYGFICDLGLVKVRFSSVLTTAGAIGSRVYAKGAGDLGADQGTADVLTTDSTSLANARYLGRAVAAPSASSLTTVLLDEKFVGIL